MHFWKDCKILNVVRSFCLNEGPCARRAGRDMIISTRVNKFLTNMYNRLFVGPAKKKWKRDCLRECVYIDKSYKKKRKETAKKKEWVRITNSLRHIVHVIAVESFSKGENDSLWTFNVLGKYCKIRDCQFRNIFFFFFFVYFMFRMCECKKLWA